MYLPDPSYVAFGTAVVALATAITSLVRVLLEKKHRDDLRILKKGQHTGYKPQVILKKSALSKDSGRDLEQGVRIATLLHDLGRPTFQKKLINM